MKSTLTEGGAEAGRRESDKVYRKVVREEGEEAGRQARKARGREGEGGEAGGRKPGKAIIYIYIEVRRRKGVTARRQEARRRESRRKAERQEGGKATRRKCRWQQEGGQEDMDLHLEQNQPPSTRFQRWEARPRPVLGSGS